MSSRQLSDGESLAQRAQSVVNYGWRGLRLLSGFVSQAPIHCIVQVSNRCNLTCGFCSFWEHPAARRDEMTVADFEMLSAKLAEGGSMVVSVEGGEPLLRPDITDIVRAFARYHHPILFSNGWRVTDALAGELWRAGLTQVGVSIDYAVPEQHDDHRGQVGTFAAAVRAAEILRDAAPRGGRSVCLMTVLMHDNVDQLEDLLKLSAGLGVRHQVTLISTQGGGRHERAQGPPPGDVGARLLSLRWRYPHLIAFAGYLEAVDQFLATDVRKPCVAGRRFLNIDHMGNVSPCIEKLHWRAGNLLHEPWSVIHQRLCEMEEPRSCGDCMTSCRGFVDQMSVPSLRSAWQLVAGHANVSLVKE